MKDSALAHIARDIAIQRAINPGLTENREFVQVAGEITIGCCNGWRAIRFGDVPGCANSIVVVPPNEALAMFLALENTFKLGEWDEAKPIECRD